MSILLKNTLKLSKFCQFFKRRVELKMFRDETNTRKKVHCAVTAMLKKLGNNPLCPPSTFAKITSCFSLFKNVVFDTRQP